MHLHCFSASEIICIAEVSSLSIEDTIRRLRDAGLDSIPGGGAEILDDEVRYKIARLKCLTNDWLNVHRTAHKLGMRTTATMMFGVGETYEHRINHFQCIYDLQEETGGFTAFIPWSFQPQNTALGGRGWDEATAVEYLKTLAIARIFLSNFENVQSSWVTQGLKVCQTGLRFGGNDVGSVMIEENVVRAAGVRNCTTEEELRRIIRDAGFRPAQRDTLVHQVLPELTLDGCRLVLLCYTLPHELWRASLKVFAPNSLPIPTASLSTTSFSSRAASTRAKSPLSTPPAARRDV